MHETVVKPRIDDDAIVMALARMLAQAAVKKLAQTATTTANRVTVENRQGKPTENRNDNRIIHPRS